MNIHNCIYDNTVTLIDNTVTFIDNTVQQKKNTRERMTFPHLWVFYAEYEFSNCFSTSQF